MDSQDFRLDTRIGDGAHSEVFLATLSPTEHNYLSRDFPSLKKEVAMKVLTKASFDQAEQEALLMRELAHPNICELYGIYAHKGKYCLAMEYHIQDLFSFAFPPEGGEPMAESEALHIFSQVLLGVAHMHSLGFLHGDIKLENVLMSGTRACLTDFGKADVFTDTEERVYPVGTLPYTAPETLRKSPVVGPEIDVWSLGVLLYALIEGYFPFYGDTRRKMRAAMAYPLRFAKASLGAQVLIASMLTRRPQQRPSTAELLQSPLIARVTKKFAAEQQSTEMVCEEEILTRREKRRSSDEQAVHEVQQILFGKGSPVAEGVSLKAQAPEGCGISPPPTPCLQQDAQLVH